MSVSVFSCPTFTSTQDKWQCNHSIKFWTHTHTNAVSTASSIYSPRMMTIWPLRDYSNRQHLLSLFHCVDTHFVAFCLVVLSIALLRCVACHVVSSCVVLCCVVLGLSLVVFFYITLCRVALCYAVVSRRVVLCCLMPCRAESCRVVLNCCCVVLNCNVLPIVWDLSCFGSNGPRICQSITQLNRLILLASISVSISREHIR